MLKEKANELMVKLKENNKDANWKNLVTGVVVLIVVLVFSIIYFSDSRLAGRGNDSILNFGSEEVSGISDSENESFRTAIVQPGEGMWHVAVRMCGDGEKYIYIAEANQLGINSAVEKGQELIINCGDK
jgi:hypothetical protein